MVSIELGVEQIDSIVLDELLGIYKRNLVDIRELEAFENPPDYKLEDLEYDLELKKALEFLIQYFTTERQFQLLMQEIANELDLGSDS